MPLGCRAGLSLPTLASWVQRPKPTRSHWITADQQTPSGKARLPETNGLHDQPNHGLEMWNQIHRRYLCLVLGFSLPVPSPSTNNLGVLPRGLRHFSERNLLRLTHSVLQAARTIRFGIGQIRFEAKRMTIFYCAALAVGG